MRAVLSAAARMLLPAACKTLPDIIAARPISAAVDVLHQWQAMLTSPQLPQQQVTTDMLRHLVQAAVRVQQGRDSSAVLPQEVTSTFMAAYERLLQPGDKAQLLELLAGDFGTSSSDTEQAVAAWSKVAALKDKDEQRPEALGRATDRLRAACEPLYMSLLLPISQQPQGIGFLVRLQSDLLEQLQQPSLAASRAAPLRGMSNYLRRCLATWFSPGLLQLRRVTWDNSSAALLETVLRSDAVHPMSTLEQLKPRLDPASRRCFVYMHPSLPEVPLVVLHTALVTQVPQSMAEILGATQDPHGQKPEGQGRYTAGSSGSSASSSSSTSGAIPGLVTFRPSAQRQSSSSSRGHQPPSVACFYSISSTQPGLSGVDLGTNLIKTVARQLKQELPSIDCLVTLSPLPGFRAWLHTRLQQQLGREGHHGNPQQQVQAGGGKHEEASSWDPGLQLLTPADTQLLQDCWKALSECEPYLPGYSKQGSTLPSPAQQLEALLEQDAWQHLPAPLQQEFGGHLLLRLAAVYLLQEKRRGLALDPVANFHLRNGAAVWRLCWRADTSERGLRRSHGIMVNYRYDLDQLSVNNKAYLLQRKVAASPQVEALLYLHSLA